MSRADVVVFRVWAKEKPVSQQRDGVRRYGAKTKPTNGQGEEIPWRKVGRAKTAKKGDGFKPRKVKAHDAAKAQLEVRPISVTGRTIEHIEDARGRTTVSIEDLREDFISVLRNSHLTSEEIRARGGPAASTINRILERTTLKPQLNTIRSGLLICDFDLAIVPRRT
jgi:hypothetical protein